MKQVTIKKLKSIQNLKIFYLTYLMNKKFREFPISNIYCIIEQSSNKQYQNELEKKQIQDRFKNSEKERIEIFEQLKIL